MLREIFLQAWDALRRNPTRSVLTMAGIIWGIVTVTLLIAYGGGFRTVLVTAFESFGKSAVICWPGQTSGPSIRNVGSITPDGSPSAPGRIAWSAEA